MYDEVVFKEMFMLKYCHNRCKTQEMCVKAVDLYLPSLKFCPDWFVTNKVLENLNGAVFFNHDIVFPDIDSNIVTFFSNGLGLFYFLAILYTLIILTLIMIMFIIMTLELLFMFKLWPSIIDMRNARHMNKK